MQVLQQGSGLRKMPLQQLQRPPRLPEISSQHPHRVPRLPKITLHELHCTIVRGFHAAKNDAWDSPAQRRYRRTSPSAMSAPNTKTRRIWVGVIQPDEG
jgi:hypothetical protein